MVSNNCDLLDINLSSFVEMHRFARLSSDLSFVIPDMKEIFGIDCGDLQRLVKRFSSGFLLEVSISRLIFLFIVTLLNRNLLELSLLPEESEESSLPLSSGSSSSEDDAFLSLESSHDSDPHTRSLSAESESHVSQSDPLEDEDDNEDEEDDEEEEEEDDVDETDSELEELDADKFNFLFSVIFLQN